MTYKDAIDFINAIETIAEHLECDEQNVINKLGVWDTHHKKIINEAIRKYHRFYQMDLVDRGKVFGITITMNEG